MSLVAAALLRLFSGHAVLASLMVINKHMFRYVMGGSLRPIA
jgi:hypothetical protein